MRRNGKVKGEVLSISLAIQNNILVICHPEAGWVLPQPLSVEFEICVLPTPRIPLSRFLSD